MLNTEIQLYPSPRKTLLLIGSSALLVALCIYLLNYSVYVSVLFAWLGILVCSLGVIIGLLRLLEHKPQMIINKLGIYDRTLYEGLIHWDVIQKALPLQKQSKEVVKLVLLSTNSAGEAVKASPGSIDEAQEINLALEGLNIQAEILTQFIQEVVAHVPGTRKDAAQAALPALQEQIKLKRVLKHS
ncbi:STM3941 family protein [Pontibacter sp. SGAir0037]|uniref:STM3941 family protein n=1 Tax=Pontibacter sp. SGAir0037 TaxID=2571030 RepID=UPI0010CD02B5|nr:STM3941 family protein [Pontibacter sp. SGAir0037]QCR24219.1 hypothetical protein C1N53_18905 [Pontibacter sp. SGAir0037]